MIAKKACSSERPYWESNHEAVSHCPYTTEQMSDVNEFDSVPPRSWILWTRIEVSKSVTQLATPLFLREVSKGRQGLATKASLTTHVDAAPVQSPSAFL